MARSDDFEGPVGYNNSNGSRGGIQDGNERGSPQDDRSDGKSLDDHGTSDPDPDFSPYLRVVEELKSQMVAGQKVMEKVHLFFTRQQREIQDTSDTRRRLTEMARLCEDYKTTIKTLRYEGIEKEEALAEKAAEIEGERQVLERAKEAAAKHEKQLVEEKEKFDKRKSTAEAEQKLKLHEQMRNLEKQQNERYEQRLKSLDRETNKRQDDDKKRVAELEAKNSQLSKKIEAYEARLKEAETKLKDARTLKTFYEEKAEKLAENLKVAENEFGLNTESTQFYKDRFLKIYSDVQDISSRYLKEPLVGDLNALHDKIKHADKDFTSVPISSSEASATLLVLHAQRVISRQLQEIIWQTFSSETALQNPKCVSLFTQISGGLLEYYGKSCGPRAARLWTALTVHGLQSQVPPAPLLSTPRFDRARVFSDKVMEVLSLLVKPSLHPNFQKSLLDLAVSAISIWDIAQTDEREIIVDLNLDLKSLEGWREDIPRSQTGAIVLFPRINARSCSRITHTRPVGPPGGWIDSEPEVHLQETLICGGKGMGKWSLVVVDGKKEEEERKVKERKREREEQRRKLEEDLKNLAEE